MKKNAEAYALVQQLQKKAPLLGDVLMHRDDLVEWGCVWAKAQGLALTKEDVILLVNPLAEGTLPEDATVESVELHDGTFNISYTEASPHADALSDDSGDERQTDEPWMGSRAGNAPGVKAAKLTVNFSGAESAKVTTHGKPLLFFATNAADESWREKEKIVSVIESYMQPVPEPYVFSGCEVPNIAGDLTQVDTLFSTMPDPRSGFSFLETRDSGEQVGRPYVEQVIGRAPSLGLAHGGIVATSGFSRPAIRLANSAGLPLRVLRSEELEAAKEWFTADTISVRFPLVDIDHASVLVRDGERIGEFVADRARAREPNILVRKHKPDQYSVISLYRVFDVDVIGDAARPARVLASIPHDGAFHKVPAVAVQYEEPRLYISILQEHSGTEGNTAGSRVLPIGAIVFFARISYGSYEAPIEQVYSYIDANNNQTLAELVVGQCKTPLGQLWACLLRYRLDGQRWWHGGALYL